MTMTMTTTIRRMATGVALLCAAVRCDGYPGDLLDGPPARYRHGLELIRLSLAMNDRWSAVFGERLNAGVEAIRHPDPSFCERVYEADATVVDPFRAVRAIAARCSHSGMYVEYGVTLLRHSAMCFFRRVTAAHLSAVEARMHGGPDERFERFLDRLVDDYRAVAAKLSVIGAPVAVVLQLAVFFAWVRSRLRALDENTVGHTLATDAAASAVALREMIETELGVVCAEMGTDWWDEENRTVVDMAPAKNKKKKDKKKKKKKKKKNKENKENKEEEDGDYAVIARADELRILMRRVFDDMIADGMSPEVWEIIFANNLLVRHSDIQKIDEAHVDDDDDDDEFNF